MLRTSRAEGERDSREEAQEDQGASAFALRGYGVTRGIGDRGQSSVASRKRRREDVRDISVKSVLSVVKGLEVV